MTQPLILHKDEGQDSASLRRIYYAMGHGKAIELIPSILTSSTRITSPVPIYTEDENVVDGLIKPPAVVAESLASIFLGLKDLQDEFAETSAISMEIEPFACSPCQWRQVGPPDYRRYAIAEQVSASLQGILTELTGEKFKAQLADFTQLELGRILSFEVRRIQAGDYQMLNDCYPEPSGLDLIMCVVEGVDEADGSAEASAWHYLVEGEVQFVVPLKTGLSLVYRTDTCQRFQRRLSSRAKTVAYQILLTFAVDSSESHYECRLGEESEREEVSSSKRRRQ